MLGPPIGAFVFLLFPVFKAPGGVTVTDVGAGLLLAGLAAPVSYVPGLAPALITGFVAHRASENALPVRLAAAVLAGACSSGALGMLLGGEEMSFALGLATAGACAALACSLAVAFSPERKSPARESGADPRA
jgi:hypothetical protein